MGGEIVSITDWLRAKDGRDHKGAELGERDAEVIATVIVNSYRNAKSANAFRVDEFLFQWLCEVIERQFAEDVLHRFQRRRSRGYHKAELLLKWDIIMAIGESDHSVRRSSPS